MKKFIAVLLVLCLVPSMAFADEILFRDIPWGTDYNTVLSILSDFYFVDFGEANVRWDAYKPYSFLTINSDNGIRMIGIPMDEDIKVAGYPVGVELLFAYGVDGNTVLRDSKNSKLMLASYIFDVTDVEATFMDLEKKMTSIYGEGMIEQGFIEDIIWTSYDEKAVVWYGDGNTGVMLLAHISHETDAMPNMVRLIYGVTSDDYVDGIDRLLKGEIIEQESKDRNKNAQNIDGL